MHVKTLNEMIEHVLEGGIIPGFCGIAEFMEILADREQHHLRLDLRGFRLHAVGRQRHNV